MDIQSFSDQAIEKEVGRRIKVLRLRKNISQQALATAACTHRNVIGALENGKGSTLSTLIGVLRELDALTQLDSFIPEINISIITIRIDILTLFEFLLIFTFVDDCLGTRDFPDLLFFKKIRASLGD